MEFKKFIIVWLSAIAIGSMLLAGGIHLLYRNEAVEEDSVGTGENHHSVHWIGFDPEYNGSYPDYCICINYLKETTLSMNIALQIRNQEPSDYWFRIEEHEVPPTGWTLPTMEVGLISVDETWSGVYSPNRTRPTSIAEGLLTESISVAVEAYEDAAYSILYSEDNFTVTYHFLDLTAVAWTELYHDDFDDGTTQGWAGYDPNVSHTYFRSPPYSLYDSMRFDKTFNVSATYSEAYLIFSMRGDTFDTYDMKIEFDGTVYFMPDVRPLNDVWYQFAIPLPTNATTSVRINPFDDHLGQAYLDDVYVLCYETPSVPGDLVITEIMQNPAAVSDAYGEYFEIYNPTDYTFDLKGMVIKDNGIDYHTITSTLLISPSSYLVLCINDNSTLNGGFTGDYQYSKFLLANSDDEVILMSGGTLIDEVAYDGGITFPDPIGASMNLDPSAFDAVSNDDGANWCESTSVFGDGDRGTPGSANDSCGP